jgi:hypothetical protein
VADGEHDRALDPGVHLLALAADRLALDDEQHHDGDEHAHERVARAQRAAGRTVEDEGVFLGHGSSLVRTGSR